MLIAISESRRPRRNSVRYPVNAGLDKKVENFELIARPIQDVPLT